MSVDAHVQVSQLLNALTSSVVNAAHTLCISPYSLSETLSPKTLSHLLTLSLLSLDGLAHQRPAPALPSSSQGNDTVRQLRVLRQRNNDSCGYYALYNALVLLSMISDNTIPGLLLAVTRFASL